MSVSRRKRASSGAPSTLPFDSDKNGDQLPDPMPCVSADQMKKTKQRWFLPGWIPFPSITVLAGPGDVGKSSLVPAIIAAWTGGPKLPGQGRWKPGNVLIFSAEEDITGKTLHKLEVAGAKMPRVHFPGLDREGNVIREPVLTGEMAELKQTIRAKEASLVVIDPFAAYVTQGQLDLNSQQQVRAVLKQIKKLAHECKCCVLLVMHVNKSRVGRMIDRLFGSAALSQVPRSTILIGHHPRIKDRRVMIQGKHNDYQAVPAQTFDLVDQGDHQLVVWRGPEDMEPEDMAAAPAGTGQRSLLELAKQLLRKRIGDGWVASTELLAEARTLGIGETTLGDARAILKVQTERRGGVVNRGHGECGPPAGGWLPEDPETAPGG